jgi:23S rRNA pseudouridine1911/1915/1917 synthase
MAMTTRTATIDETTAGRLDAVVRQLTTTSHSQTRGIVGLGCVEINGVTCDDPSRTVAAGDAVSIRWDPIQRYREKKKRWDDHGFNVVFEDVHLIVVDKAAGVLTVPTDRNEDTTLIDRVTRYLGHSRRHRQAWVVHRLDRGVSGLLVLGKNERVGQQLIDQFKQRKPQRVYRAIVAGVIGTDKGTYRSHLATGKNLDRYSTAPSTKTEAAVTHYSVRTRLSDTTVVDVQLETGKRNQIRVHFAEAGHPVLGDPRYGDALSSHPRWVRRRLALHAQYLGFTHPATGKQIKCNSPTPMAFEKFLASESQ